MTHSRPMNNKLTHVIRGRGLAEITRQGDVATVRFDDGSQMTVKLPPNAPTLEPTPAGKIARARQDDTTLELDLDSGATMLLPLAEATSSVLLRGADHSFQYAD